MKLIILILALTLSGCAGGMIPISDESISTVTGGATTSVGYVTDVSAIKEMAVHKTLQNRDKMVRDAHKNSGMSVGWIAIQETVFYPGMTEPITVTRYLPTISYNEQAKFDQPLPTKPSEHPAWRTAEKLGSALIRGTVIGYGINAASDVLQTAIGNSGHNTTGSHNTDGSHNIDDSGNSDSSATAYDYSDNSDNSNNSDNSVGPVDNSDSSDNSEIDNSNNSDNSTDNSAIIPEA